MTEYFISQYKDDPQNPLYCCSIGDLSDEKGDYERSKVEYFEIEYFLMTRKLLKGKGNGYRMEAADEISNSHAHSEAKRKFKNAYRDSFLGGVVKDCFSMILGDFINDIIVFWKIAEKIERVASQWYHFS